MLAFESQTPQELLKEIAQYLRQLAAMNQNSMARTITEQALNGARANALTLAAMDLESAGIIPAKSPLRTDPRTEMCDTCNHSHEDHDAESMGGQCWNGSGNGNRCACNEYAPKGGK